MRRFVLRPPRIMTWQSYTLTILGSTSNPTKGTVGTDQAFFRVNGDVMEIRYGYAQSAAGAAGSGDYIFSLPTGYTIKDLGLTLGNTFNGVTGVSSGYDGTNNFTGICQIYSTLNGVSMLLGNAGTNPTVVGSGFMALNGTTVRLGFWVSVPIAQKTVRRR